MIDIALWAQVLVFLVVTGVVLSTGQASVFHPAVWYLGFHLIVFVLRPILVHCFGFTAEWNYMMFSPSEGIFVKTLAVSSAGLIVFVGASLIGGWTNCGFQEPQPVRFSALQRRGLWLSSLSLLPLVIWSIYATRNGIKRELGGTAAYVLTDSTGYLNEAQNVLAPLLCSWLVATRFCWMNLLPAALYIGYRSWYGWSRWTILLYVVMVVATYCWYYRKRWLPLWSIAAAIPVFLLFNVLGHNREMLKAYLEHKPVEIFDYAPGIATAERTRLKYDGPDFANFDFLAYIIAFVPEHTEGFSYGAQHTQLFTEPIPRILWKGKPVGAPLRTINPYRYGNFLGLTVSLPGDGWISGGWAGLVLTCGIGGVVLGLCHRRFWATCERPLVALFYIAGLAMLPQLYRDGSYVSLAKFLLFAWLPFLLWAGFNWVLGHCRVPQAHGLLTTGANVVQIHGQGGNGWVKWEAHQHRPRRS